MGYQGSRRQQHLFCAQGAVAKAETTWQQLLEIWNKAKGKERDAMLWGDEVRSLHTSRSGALMD